MDAEKELKVTAGTAPARIYSIGHSTRPFDDFASLLDEFGIAMLVDIRRFPGSRRYPHFNRDHLAQALPARGVSYRWMEELGGRRHSKAVQPSPNIALRNASFRAYADYMLTPPFTAAVDELLAAATHAPLAIMCSEAVYWRCHRRLVSDYLVTRSVVVQHIMGPRQLRPHVLTSGALPQDGKVIYAGPTEAGKGPRARSGNQ